MAGETAGKSTEKAGKTICSQQASEVEPKIAVLQPEHTVGFESEAFQPAFLLAVAVGRQLCGFDKSAKNKIVLKMH